MPGSITYLMPGTVSEVSATLVASTIRRPVWRWKTRCCSACESRAYSGSTSVYRQLLLVQRVRGVADLPLAGEEDQDVARALGLELVDGVADRGDLVAVGVLAVLLEQRPVADLDRVRTAADLDDRGVAEVPGEALRVDGRRGDDDLEVGAPGQQLGQIAEQEVDVEAALVGLVDDDRVVRAQLAVGLDLGEQDAVRHQLDEGGVRARPGR